MMDIGKDTWRIEQIDEATKACSRHLAGLDPALQSAVLADLLATWLAAFQGPDIGELRKILLAQHLDLVGELIGPNEARLRERKFDG